MTPSSPRGFAPPPCQSHAHASMSREPGVQLPVPAAAAAPSSKALGKRRLDDDEPSSSGAAPQQQATLAQAVQKRERRVTRSSRGQQATAEPSSPGNSTDGEGAPRSFLLVGTSANLVPPSRTCSTEVLARPDESSPSLETAPESRPLSDYRTVLLGCSRRDFDF